jgi:APA family basic amino acid/polyamine antiporter
MLIFYGIGMILGAGIYSVIGKAAIETGTTLWWGFLFAGFSALLTALSYTELATMFPKAGAEFIYLSHAFKKHKWLASTIGIAVAFSGAATATAVSLSFAGYLQQFFNITIGVVAFMVLFVFTLIGINGIKSSGWVTVFSTLVEIGGLALVIYLGFTHEEFGDVLTHIPHQGTVTGTALIVFSFFGFENIANLAEEAKDPDRTLPRAILWSIGISTLLYILVSLSAIAIVTPAELAESKAPLMTVAEASSNKMGKILGAIALFSTANTALISLIGGARILYGMGNEKALPSVIANVLPKQRSPWVAHILIFLAACLLLPLGKLETVASVSSLATMVAFLSVNIALIKLRYSHKHLRRPFKVPINLGNLPIIPVLASILCVLFMTQFEWKVYAVGFSFMLVAALYFIWNHHRNKGLAFN